MLFLCQFFKKFMSNSCGISVVLANCLFSFSDSFLSIRFRSTSGLMYNIQASLDSLGNSRQELICRLIEIDKTMTNPKDDDVERLRYCPNCYDVGDGALCLHCELDNLFQVGYL